MNTHYEVLGIIKSGEPAVYWLRIEGGAPIRCGSLKEVDEKVKQHESDRVVN